MRLDIPDSAITISEDEAFRLLIKSLNMNCVLDEYTDFFVEKDDSGDNCVYVMHGDMKRKYDDRGDLFVALRNVAVKIIPNLAFRNADYINGRWR